MIYRLVCRNQSIHSYQQRRIAVLSTRLYSKNRNKTKALMETHREKVTFSLPMERRFFCNILFLFIIICQSDSLILKPNDLSFPNGAEASCDKCKSQLPSLFILSMPMQFHYSMDWCLLVYVIGTMLSIANSLRSKFDITIGVFNKIAHAEQGDLYKHKVTSMFYSLL